MRGGLLCGSFCLEPREYSLMGNGGQRANPSKEKGMSCDRRCFDPNDKHFNHDDCATCPGRDDGPKPKERAMSSELMALDDSVEKVIAELGHLAMACAEKELEPLGSKLNELAYRLDNLKDRAPMELTDSESSELLSVMLRSIEFKHVENHKSAIGNAARKWWAERSGG
jgi:hypothetical protein